MTVINTILYEAGTAKFRVVMAETGYDYGSFAIDYAIGDSSTQVEERAQVQAKGLIMADGDDPNDVTYNVLWLPLESTGDYKGREVIPNLRPQ